MSSYEVPTFQEELEALINKHSLERHSGTPDFILAEYMADCLHMFNKAVYARSKHYASVGGAVEHSVQSDECQESCELGGVHEFSTPVQICSKCGTRR